MKQDDNNKLVKVLPNYLYKKIIGYVLEHLKYCKPAGSGPNHLKNLISSNLKPLMLVNKIWYSSWVTDSLLFLPEYRMDSDTNQFKLPWFKQLLDKEYRFIVVSSKSLESSLDSGTDYQSIISTQPITKVDPHEIINQGWLKNIDKFLINNNEGEKSYSECSFYPLRLPFFENITKLYITFSLGKYWNEFIDLMKPITITTTTTTTTQTKKEIVGKNIQFLSFRFQTNSAGNQTIPNIDLSKFDEIIENGGLKQVKKLFVMDCGVNGITGFNSLLGKQLTSLALYSCKQVDGQQLIDLLSSNNSPLEYFEFKDCKSTINTDTLYDVINNTNNKLQYFYDSTPKDVENPNNCTTMTKVRSFLSNLSDKVEKVSLIKTIYTDAESAPKPPPLPPIINGEEMMDNIIWMNSNAQESCDYNKSKPETSICKLEQLSFMIPLPRLSLLLFKDIEFKYLRSLEMFFTEVDDIDILVDAYGSSVLANLVRLKISSDYESKTISNKFYNFISGQCKNLVELVLIGFNYTSKELIEFLSNLNRPFELLSLEGETNATSTQLLELFSNDSLILNSLDLSLQFTKMNPLETYKLLLELLKLNKFYHLSFLVQNTRNIKDLPINDIVDAIKKSDKLRSFNSGQYNLVSNILSKACIDSGKSNYFSAPTTLKYFSCL